MKALSRKTIKIHIYILKKRLNNFKDGIYHIVILFRLHKTEADIFFSKPLIIGTVTYHEALLNTVLEYICGSLVFLQKLNQYKVCLRFKYLDGLPAGQCGVNKVPLCLNQALGQVDIVFILKHYSCNRSIGIDIPRNPAVAGGFKEILVAGNRIAKTESRSSKELGDTAEYNQVVVFFGQTTEETRFTYFTNST